MIITQVIINCIIFDYPDCPSELPSAWGVHLTERGLQRYIDANIQFSSLFINGLKVDDQIFEVAGTKFMLTDMHLSQFNVPGARIQFRDDNSLIARFENIGLKFMIHFKVQQQFYPYLQDGGDGSITIGGMSISMKLNSFSNDKCKWHYFIKGSEPDCAVDVIKVKLDGKLAFLYDSLMGILTNLIKATFNSALGQNIVVSLVSLANGVLEDDISTALTYSQPLSSDERNLGLVIQNGFLVQKTTGFTLYSSTNPYFDRNAVLYGCPENIESVKQFQNYFTNHDVQYHVNIIVFQSLFNNLFKYVYNGSDFIQLKEAIQSIKFVNTGLLAKLTFENFEAFYLIKINMSQRLASYKTNMTLIQPVMDTQLNCTGSVQQCSSKEIEGLMDKLNYYFHEHGPEYRNANQMEICNPVFHEERWMFASCNVAKYNM